MFYLDKKGKEVVKYEVQIHQKGLEEVRDRLIKYYSSTINIYNLICLSNINDIDNDVIKDFKKNNNYVNFKYYIYPELVILIDMLIAGNVSALDKIINYEIKDIKARELLNDYHVLKICNDISNSLNIEFNSNDLMFYINNYGLNIKNEDYLFLKEELIKCITFKKCDSINADVFYKVLDFIDSENNYNYIKSKKKVKK